MEIAEEFGSFNKKKVLNNEDEDEDINLQENLILNSLSVKYISGKILKIQKKKLFKKIFHIEILGLL